MMKITKLWLIITNCASLRHPGKSNSSEPFYRFGYQSIMCYYRQQ